MDAFLRYLPCLILLSQLLLQSSTAPSGWEDTAADAVAAAFVKARQTAALSKLERIDGNALREKACKHDLRFPSGLIGDVFYDASNPAQLPESAVRLAAAPDSGRTVARFVVGVCLSGANPNGQPTYSVLIATYESRWNSFWRIFWE
jgi:hypothetical protein